MSRWTDALRRRLDRPRHAARRGTTALAVLATLLALPVPGSAVKGMSEPQVVSVSARVQIWPERQHLEADVELTVRTSGVRPLSLVLFSVRNGKRGLEILEVSQQGQPCRYEAQAERLLVHARPAVEPTAVRIRYRGDVNLARSSYVTAEDLLLRSPDGGWLPIPLGTGIRFDVRAVHPVGFQVFGQGRLTSQAPAEAGWTETSWSYSGSGFSLYGAPRYEVRRATVAGLELTMALWPRDAGQLPRLQRLLGSALEGLHMLGPFPYPQLRVVESGIGGGNAAWGVPTNMALGENYLKGEESSLRRSLAHELAHSWFGGAVPLAPAAQKQGVWSEPLAEYSAMRSLPEAEAQVVRQRWSRNYAAVAPRADAPLLSTSPDIENAIVHVLSYNKGPLLLVELEDRIGPERMTALLRSFLAARKDRPSTWSDFVDSLAALSPPAAVWFEASLGRRGAPALELTSVQRTTAGVQGELRQHGRPSFEGSVELGLLDRERRLLATWRAPFAGARTAFSGKDVAGAEYLVLDPRHRMPLRYAVTAEGPAFPQEVPLRRP